MVSVVTSERAAEFLTYAGDYLRTRPAEHSVILTGAGQRTDGTDGDDLWAWALAGGGPVVAAAMHTPPFGVYVSLGPDDAIGRLAETFHDRGRALPGIGGMVREAEAFAGEWARRTGATISTSMRQGLYVADAVTPPAGVPGRMRRAEDADVPLLVEWAAGFQADTGLPVEMSSDITDRVAAGRLWIWADGDEPVSMAGVTAPAGGVSRVQLVYTPKQLRGRGYASACVAALTNRELAEPGRTCMLYTDLANPTSNGIYQAVGYRRIGEAVQLTFG